MNNVNHVARTRPLLLAILGSSVFLGAAAMAQPVKTPGGDAPVMDITEAMRTRAEAEVPDGYVASGSVKGPTAGEAGVRAEQSALANSDLPRDEALARLEARVLSGDLDTVTAADIRKMDGEGLIERRKNVGEDILFINREMERATAISALVETMGHDAFKLAYPELYELISDSPIILGAKIRQQELLNDLEIAKRGPEEESSEEDVVEEAALAPRSDGSSYFNLPKGPLPEPIAKDEPDEAAEPAEDGAKLEYAADGDATDPARSLATGSGLQITDVADVSDFKLQETISLREIYGMGDTRRAIILHGSDRIVVRVGDDLPGDTRVTEIGDSHIDIVRDGEEIRIQLNG